VNVCAIVSGLSVSSHLATAFPTASPYDVMGDGAGRDRFAARPGNSPAL
jgi:hypothetical protein